MRLINWGNLENKLLSSWTRKHECILNFRFSIYLSEVNEKKITSVISISSVLVHKKTKKNLTKNTLTK